ncbi:MAG: O-methyltransferase [Bilifractor sp.]|jgi:predicted O-methyltransferase YrrM|nr:O-methyltransferase [Lachnospiraceae bacterium]
MIVDERMLTFINSLDRGLTPFLEDLREKAEKDEVPIIRRNMQSFLRTWLTITKPTAILEIGTAVGFSAILMASYGDPTAKITTIEDFDRRIPVARENFRKSGYEDRITLLEGDAAEILPKLEGPYDFIFLDAAKGQYIRFLPEIRRMMRSGSVLIADNVLQGGDIIESHYIVERRNRTIYRRMREFLRAIEDDEGLESCVLPVGDGISISVAR